MKLALLLILLSSITVHASDCYDRLMSTEYYSTHHRVDGVVFADHVRTFSEKVGVVLSILNNQLKCDIAFNAPVCKRLVADKKESNVCFATSQYGYAIISRDYNDSYNITFNRWD